MDRKKLRERAGKATPYVLALVTAVLLRLLVDNLYDSGRRFEVPLSVRGLPAGLVLASIPPGTVTVKLTGDKAALESPELASRLTAWVSLGRVSVGTNLASVRVGDTTLPFSVNFHSVSPARVSLVIRIATNLPVDGVAP